MKPAPRLVSFHCTVRDEMGTVLSSSFNRDVLMAPGIAGVDPPGLIEGLCDIKRGERRQIRVKPERGYGFYDPDLVMRVPRSRLPQGATLQVGFQIFTRAVSGEPRIFRVTEAFARSVVIDGNHPLAGRELHYEIQATSARAATPRDFRANGFSTQPPETPVLRSKYGPYLQ
jgi:FKBP-type peptidyl-prolyl cis-trans isomerase SlyD